ncbi:hypothetical protein [Candidatus Chlorohelix sp.]|uniref:hypothetical protein n=1 Tax=Candidatus Chlorohelix sp. TaxID=3139201 RepID=UPI0030609A7A
MQDLENSKTSSNFEKRTYKYYLSFITKTIYPYIYTKLRNYNWLITSILCLILGYMLVWQRGFYSDDYLFKFMPSEVKYNQPRAGAWAMGYAFYFFIPDFEIIPRLIVCLAIGVTAFLLGWLIYQILGSKLAAVISGWILLMPFYASEATLWAFVYIIISMLALIFLIACWKALAEPNHRIVKIIIGTLAYALMLYVEEPLALVILLVPLLGLTQLESFTRLSAYWSFFKRITIILICPSLVAVGFYLVFYRNSTFIEGRGGLDTNIEAILQRPAQYMQRLEGMTISSDWGLPLTKEVFNLGLSVIVGSWKGITLFLLLIVALIWTVFSWKPSTNEYKMTYKTGVIVFLSGIIWIALLLFIPGILIKGQILEYRMLYFPYAGLGIALGSLFWIINKKFQYIFVSKIWIVLVGALLLFSSICTTGFAESFAIRYDLDQKEVNAITKALPSQALPEKTILVPVATVETYPAKYVHAVSLLFGVLETNWSLSASIQNSYQRKDLYAVTGNKWAPIQLSSTATPNLLRVGNSELQIDHLLLFSYRWGTVYVIKDLRIIDENNALLQTIEFPIAANLSQNGVPIINLQIHDGALIF